MSSTITATTYGVVITRPNAALGVTVKAGSLYSATLKGAGTVTPIVGSATAVFNYVEGTSASDTISYNVVLSESLTSPISATIQLLGAANAPVSEVVTTLGPVQGSSVITTTTNGINPITSSDSDTITSSTIPTSSDTITSSTIPTSSDSSDSGTSRQTSTGARPTSPAQQASSNNTGALAGAAIGCLIGGALIAGFFVWFFLRKRDKRRRRYAGESRELSSLSGHGQAVQVSSKAWEKHLPQSESDDTIRQKATALFDQIELHVENFYSDNIGALSAAQYATFADNANITRVPHLAVQGLTHGARPSSAIKYAIGNIIISKIDIQAKHSGSLLPPEFTAPQMSPSAQSRPGFDQAFSQWRVLTAYLRPDANDDISHQEAHQRTINNATAEICQTFEPWARSRDRNDSCFKSMAGIMKRASDLGILLFSQPASFRWNWGTRTTRDLLEGSDLPTELTILPGLDKVSDKDGQHLTMPLRIVGTRNGPWRIA